MATADSVKAKIQSLISKSNTATGRSDTDMTSAVDALISGYGNGGSSPSGTISITENGTFDVSDYASAEVAVPIPETIAAVHSVAIPSDLGNGANATHTLLSGDSFVAEHYADEGFAAMLIPISLTAAAANVTHFVYHGNRNIGASDLVRYGVAFYNTSATAYGLMQATAKLNGKGYNVCLRANSSGDINLYVASARTVKAGSYLLVLICTD